MGRLLVPVLVLMALVAGITLGGHPELLPGFVRDTLVGDEDTRVIAEAVEKVNDVYYREVSEADLADAALDGIVGSLDDRFSYYLDAEEYERFNAGGQSYAGIGISVNAVKRGLRIVEVYDESPAQRAGLRRNEIITEVEVMKLVGTTDWFIRWPFMIEGVALGALGGLVAILMLLVGKIAFIDPLAEDFALIAAPETIHFGLLAALLLVAAVGVSAAGSGLSLRRFLRV